MLSSTQPYSEDRKQFDSFFFFNYLFERQKQKSCIHWFTARKPAVAATEIRN